MESTMSAPTNASRLKFIFGGLLILAAVVYLIISSTAANSQYYVTVDELVANQSIATREVRVSGAVIGESITYDSATLTLRFTVANVPGDLDEIEKQGGLAQVLHEAVEDSTRSRMEVVYVGPKPDLLQNEAQAIMTGKIGEDGVFYAEELLLKCPTRYEEYGSKQVDG